MNIKQSILLRMRLAFLFVFLFSGAILARIVHIQFVQGEHWKQRAREKTLSYRVVKATRGNIYSDNGSLLATSVPYYRVALDPTACREDAYRSGIDSLCVKLAALYGGRSANDYRHRIDNARRAKKKYLALGNRLIDHQQKKRMQQWPILREGRYRGGALFEKMDRRVLPFDLLGKRTVGSINDESRGTVGLEFSFNRQLGGRNGEALFERIAGESWKPVNDGTEIKPEPGLDIQTTLDINLQDVAEASLLRALRAHRADYGCVVVMEVATGEVKAMANLGRVSEGNYAEKFNYAVGGLTDPGSTFKLPTMIALLEETALSPTDSIDTQNGVFKYYNLRIKDTHHGGYGKITVNQAFEKSSNVAFAKLVIEHFGAKPQRYLDYLYAFGLTRPLGFQMKGEGKPYFKNLDDRTWSGTTLPWMSIGYEAQISPLQMLAFYNAVANGGRMVQPILVKEIRMADEVLEQFQPKLINEKICSEETLKKVRAMLEGVVERGTARNIRNNDYRIAGKTGTSQKINREGRYIEGSYYTSFIGYFPADKPKYSCAVVIDNPKGKLQYGADVAAPVFKDIADKVYARDIQMHKLLSQPYTTADSTFPLLRAGYLEDLRLVCNELGVSNHARESEDWVEARHRAAAIFWHARDTRDGAVPDVCGMTLKDALYLLENKGLRVSRAGRGRVRSQSQLPGTPARRGSAIYLTLGS
ncbi:MAG: transpeptidase family protein [Ferruginibacter sp.]|nr:transpeptidase family protein [Cytophagales bacterium]